MLEISCFTVDTVIDNLRAISLLVKPLETKDITWLCLSVNKPIIIASGFHINLKVYIDRQQMMTMPLTTK